MIGTWPSFWLKESTGDVVELVELLCLAILSMPGEGEKTEENPQCRGGLLGEMIRTRFEGEWQCQCVRV